MLKLRISLIVLTVFWQITISNAAPSAENYKSAIAALQQADILLKQEDQRWQTIQSNPVTDVWTVKRDGDNIIVNITIDDPIKNIINDQPIQREYTLTPSQYSLLAPLDCMLSGCLLANSGWLPALGIGYTPKFSKGFGVTVNTTFTTLNAGVYYTNKLIPHAFIEALMGIKYTGQTTFGVGVGVKF